MSVASTYAEIEAAELPLHLRREFNRMVKAGNTPQFAMMCLNRSAPKMSHSDRAFNEKARQRMNGMQEKSRNRIVEIAKKAGIDTNGKYYQGQLGKYNDPKAWVSTDSDVLAVCRERNYGCDGAVKHKRVEMPVGPGPQLAPDIVSREAKRLLSKDPKLAEQVCKGKVKKQEVAERVIAKHGKKRLTFNGG